MTSLGITVGYISSSLSDGYKEDFFTAAELKNREADWTTGVLVTSESMMQPGQVPKCSHDMDALWRWSFRDGGMVMWLGAVDDRGPFKAVIPTPLLPMDNIIVRRLLDCFRFMVFSLLLISL